MKKLLAAALLGIPISFNAAFAATGQESKTPFCQREANGPSTKECKANRSQVGEAKKLQTADAKDREEQEEIYVLAPKRGLDLAVQFKSSWADFSFRISIG